ncbi:MAG: Spx/MgsR family transcriptional regulator [Arenicella sp.]|jgi:Spx/MgsR family transcriptional regulator
MKLYQYPNCSTCRKAVKFLTENEAQFESIDITKQPPSQDELQTMLANYQGDIRKLFNTSGMQYRQLNMKDKLPGMSTNQAIALLADNGKLIKRPFLINGDKGIVAFKQELWADFI